MKNLLILMTIAMVCIIVLVKVQFADVEKNDPQQMYEITLIKNGVAK